MAEAPQRKLVFVVDDDPAIRTLVSKALTAKGYEVIEGRDGLHASELLGNLPRTPHLVILDVMMPTIDGFSLAKMIKSHKELKSIPIIFLTAKTAPRDLATGMSVGARHYIQKPFSLQELLDKVEKSVR
jgi:DNA-binding response OmpR family regulator